MRFGGRLLRTEATGDDTVTLKPAPGASRTPQRPDDPGENAGRRPADDAGWLSHHVRARIGLLIVAVVLGTAAVLLTDFVLGSITGQSAYTSPPATPVVSSSPIGAVGPRYGWTNVRIGTDARSASGRLETDWNVQ